MKKTISTAGQLRVPVEQVARGIHVLRGQRVMRDSTLAELYHVPTFRLNEAVKRNASRFPEDFMFQLTGAVGGARCPMLSASTALPCCRPYSTATAPFR